MNLKFKKEKSFFGISNSLLNNFWVKNEPNQRLSLNISQKYSLNNIVSNLLSLRIFDANNVNDFLEPTLEKYLPNPTIFNDLKKASVRVFNAIKNKENISILGDYDVDGLSSIAILKKYFNFFGVNTFSYIPDRINEGYGPNLKAIDIIKSKKTSLLIMVDCGTNSHDIISYIKKKKLI